MAVLLRGMVRWHTFRVMLLTSLVWLILGICILVYYMECLAQNAVNCNRSARLTDDNSQLRVESNDYLSDNNINSFKVVSHQKSDSFLPHYNPNQLKTWTPRGLESTPIKVH